MARDVDRSTDWGLLTRADAEFLEGKRGVKHVDDRRSQLRRSVRARAEAVAADLELLREHGEHDLVDVVHGLTDRGALRDRRDE
jgi:hypothetical protein